VWIIFPDCLCVVRKRGKKLSGIRLASLRRTNASLCCLVRTTYHLEEEIGETTKSAPIRSDAFFNLWRPNNRLRRAFCRGDKRDSEQAVIYQPPAKTLGKIGVCWPRFTATKD
jgi:hypothetical protein